MGAGTGHDDELAAQREGAAAPVRSEPGQGWDPFDGVPEELVFARRYLKGVAFRVLGRVVTVLASAIAVMATVTGDLMETGPAASPVDPSSERSR